MVLVIAQLLSAAFIFSSATSPRETLLDINLWLIVCATLLSVAAGYIINAFFDQEKDLINRPQKNSVRNKHIFKIKKDCVYFLEWNCCVGGEQCFAKVCCVLLRVYRLYGFLLCLFEEIFVHWKYWFSTANSTSIFCHNCLFQELFSRNVYSRLLSIVTHLCQRVG